jgi:hypothetical protein
MAGINLYSAGTIDTFTNSLFLSDGSNADSTQTNNYCIALGQGATQDTTLGDGQVIVGSAANPVITTSTATAGSVAVPGTAVEFLTVVVSGQIRKIALFAQ